jgi:tetratricopeptide (TPR) repeat protein
MPARRAFECESVGETRAPPDVQHRVRLVCPPIQSAYAHDRRGSVWSEKKEYAKAIAEHSEAIRLDPQLADSYSGRAFAWLEQKEYDKAIADYNEAIRLKPDSPYTYLARAAAWSWLLKYDKALVEFSQAIRFDAEMAGAYGSRAWIWSACPDRTLRDAKKAVESAPKACELTKWNDAYSLEYRPRSRARRTG